MDKSIEAVFMFGNEDSKTSRVSNIQAVSQVSDESISHNDVLAFSNQLD